MRALRQEGGQKPARWPAAAAPHGYDRNEFHPGESHRDYPADHPAGEMPARTMSARKSPASRKREPDEERRLLREAAAAFTGPDRQDMADDPSGDDEGDVRASAMGKGEGGPSKLYRD